VADHYPVLTIRQPWCWALTHDAIAPEHHKPVENRSWPVRYRGPLWLAAGARGRWDVTGAASPLVRAAWQAWASSPAVRDRVAASPDLAVSDLTLGRSSRLLDFASVTALAEVTGCHHASDCLRGGRMCSRWAVADQFHIVIGAVFRLPDPVPVHGQLKLWYLPWEADKATRAQIPATSKSGLELEVDPIKETARG
jgi:hypothetical protein